jgi:hypothetical protein
MAGHRELTTYQKKQTIAAKEKTHTITLRKQCRVPFLSDIRRNDLTTLFRQHQILSNKHSRPSTNHARIPHALGEGAHETPPLFIIHVPR